MGNTEFPESTWTPIAHPFLRRWRTYRAILKRRVFNICVSRTQIRRSKTFVREGYGAVWRESPAAVRLTAPGRTVRDYRGTLYEVPKAAMRKIHLGELSRALEEFKGVQSVLELGSGNGINILALAALHPEIKVWRGIEMTPEGVAAAEHIRKEPPLKELVYLTDLPWDTIARRLAAADIEFQQGSILNLPFPDRSIDMVFSRLVIEQLPRDYPQAFREARRVARLGGFFLEEFYEAQSNVFQRIQLLNLDYFRASYREVERAGWKVKSFGRLPMNKVEFSFGLLVCV
ncbi:MAG: class I SAM-dependent methyltransferase [bacterium]|nr:class I SAM-dependent methyltransferase [bacterium]